MANPYGWCCPITSRCVEAWLGLWGRALVRRFLPRRVVLPSPGSRSAPWDQTHPNASTLKGLYNPFRVEVYGYDAGPRVAARPWAGEYNPFGVKNRPFGVKNRPFGVKNRPFGVKNRPFGVKNRPFGVKNRPFGVKNCPLD